MSEMCLFHGGQIPAKQQTKPLFDVSFCSTIGLATLIQLLPLNQIDEYYSLSDLFWYYAFF